MAVETPKAEQCVLRYVLERWAGERPAETFARFDDGEEWSFGETLQKTRRLAAALQSIGVAEGEHVVAWLPNGKAALAAYFAINYMGAVYVPINTAYRGDLLAHVIDNSDAVVILAHHQLVERLAQVETAKLESVVVAGAPESGARAPVGALRLLDFEAIQADAGEPSEPERVIEAWHTQSIIYTSGTTGPSKGVLSSYLHNFASMNADAWYCVRDDDRFLINMPMFHVGGSFIIYSMLCRGASIAVTEGFRTEVFWQQVRQSGSSVVFLLGAMGAFLLQQAARGDDRAHPLKTVFIVPFTEEAVHFAQRFGAEVYTIFNMTEISTPIISEPNPTQAGYCGRARAGFELRLVDENDLELPAGEVGELILRADQPWTLNHGYYKNPEATAQAWRNGWFHTGDALRRDDEGNFFFVDRIKDAIRRRGENISSAEVEAQLNEHPAVLESAAIAVPSEWGEDEVMAVLALKPGAALRPEELLEFLGPRMAHFMVPRYLRFMDELPKTPTTKIQKAELRNQGLTDDTWDREAAGIKVKAKRLS